MRESCTYGSGRGRAVKRASLPLQRREFITLLGGAATWPVAAVAQQPKVWRIGVLGPVSPTPAAMRGRGYVEGQNLSIDVRWPQGTFEHDPSGALMPRLLLTDEPPMLLSTLQPADEAGEHEPFTGSVLPNSARILLRLLRSRGNKSRSPNGCVRQYWPRGYDRSHEELSWWDTVRSINARLHV